MFGIRNVLRPTVQRLRDTWNALRHGSCAVLLYHRVIELPTDPQQLAVTPDHFDAHLQVLKERYRVLSVAEFEHHLLHQRRFPRRSVLLTFDDGYADNHTIARPILETHGLQALFYIASGYIESGREFWWDELERMLLLNEDPPAAIDLEVAGTRSSRALGDAGAVQHVYEELLDSLRRIPSHDRDALLDGLRSTVHSTEARNTHLPMTRAELSAFADSPSVVIGAHSVGHPSLARQDPEEQRREIVGSKRELEAMLGREVRYFSYPFGTGADFDATTELIAANAGFLHTAANYPGPVHARSPRHRFPRHLVRDWSGPEFAQRMGTFLPR
ncbi:MAG: polysaccharide deacetylase family protein [Flavobacteriales bacterium]|nr:polysaccharide deacetylase family protein [Flavobacteriales bacterium]